MKIQRTKYYTISLYTVVSVLIIALAIVLMLKVDVIFNVVLNTIGFVYGLFKPLVIGFIIGFLIDPIVDLYASKLSTKREDRTRMLATLLSIITIICLVGLFILMIAMNMRDVINQTDINGLASTISAYIKYFQETLDGMASKLNIGGVSDKILTCIYATIDSTIERISDWIVEFVAATGRSLMDILFGVILALYLVKDKPKLLLIWNNVLTIMLNNKVYKEITSIGRDVNVVFTGYIRGQMLDALIMTILTSVGLTIIGLDFAIIIGLVTGIFNLIPYFGPIVGLVLAGIIGGVGDAPQKGLYAILVVLTLQQLDAWIIVPKIMSDNVQLHPIAVLLAILVGGELFGLVGMLAGVPMVALMKLIIVRYLGDIFNEEYIKKHPF
ncbi:MAG: hypothetical protein BEN18_10750 [Epulopiscium sp. Nuni2H_MBin001]|nr:MAG: hypothetical protein BEN18_10750 [Epulopiscium sp. Nuni2H_MBin001]